MTNENTNQSKQVSVSTIILLLVAGAILILLEFFLLPSMIAGIAGVVLYFWGIYGAFTTLGFLWGWLITILTLIGNGLLVWFVFNRLDRSRFAVRKKIDGQVNVFDTMGLDVGFKGVAITDLRPNGEAVFGEITMSVWTFDSGFLSSGENIYIKKIANNKIFVEKSK